ncbi:DUF397 domain-containing protein [Streptomyces sp. NPDC006798]|uniref:DUF397 domain-containing protein n=1 Tax=Streptomyces sp. NPDC006798 TaxID=3155462 RepID=UPI0033D9FD2A
MSTPRPTSTQGPWRKSSYSGANGDCVEVALARGGMAVRDSKDPDAGQQAHSTAPWTTFIHAVRSGTLG